MTRTFSALLLAALAALSTLASTASAEQRRDWMIAPQPEGTDLALDLVFPGVQATAENRRNIYGFANGLTLRANSLATIPFYESQADVELRILALTLGVTGGFRSTFRNLSFGVDEPIDRSHRRERETGGDFDRATWGFFEARAGIGALINDHVVFNNVNYLRLEARPERSFDWRNGVVHDGFLMKSDNMLFFKHRDWGGIAPMFQVLDYELGDRRFTLFNYGVAVAMRPGFQARRDILFLQLLFHPGSTLSGTNNDDIYGMHILFAPITFTLAYRMVFPVDRPE